MPQASRNHNTTAQKMQDKEAKRARGVMSCAECRRLKLKCDKTVPCSSCKRRGCESICPNGSLITGQGTRFVLADTEKLHHKITQMSDRIRQLEDALFVLQSSISNETHPLLDRELLHIKSSIDLHSAVECQDGPVETEDPDESQYIDAFGTLAIRDDGAATFYGRSAGSESLLIDEESSPTPDNIQRNSHTPPNPGWQASVPDTVTSLAESFPFTAQSIGLGLDSLADRFLPQWNDAWRLCEFYLEQAPWFFGAVTKRQLYEEILPMWYPDAPHAGSSLQSSFSASRAFGSEAAPGTINPPWKGTAHDLALLFVIFCFGALTDNALPPAPDNPVAHHYFQLTRAALTLEPIIDRPPSVATVQTLSLMAIYEGLCSGENSIERTWALMGLATKLAQSIGLHKDCARFNLPPSEVQKRRALFWELFITDCWQSLATGRLPSFSLPFVDCELPYDSDQTMADDGSIQPSFSFWKARFGAECVSAVVQGTLTSRAPKYSIILRLDRKIRDMAVPKYSQGPPPQGVGLSQTMQYFMPVNYRELTLLYIHRCFFAHAISSHPNDPIKSPYAPSFLAGYRSACELITGLESQFSMFPSQIARFWVLWTHAFSSSVMLSSVVIHCTKTKVASAALIELRKAHDLFEKASQFGGRAVKFFPIIQRLWAKAQRVYQDAHNGIHHPTPNDIFSLSSARDKHDELSIFSGKTHYVVTKLTSPSVPSSGQASPSPSRPDSIPTSSPDDIVTNPAFAGMHPNLIEQLHGFDSHIRAQIQNAYRDQQEPHQHLAVPTVPIQPTQQYAAPYQPYEAQPTRAQPHYPSEAISTSAHHPTSQADTQTFQSQTSMITPSTPPLPAQAMHEHMHSTQSVPTQHVGFSHPRPRAAPGPALVERLPSHPTVHSYQHRVARPHSYQQHTTQPALSQSYQHHSNQPPSQSSEDHVSQPPAQSYHQHEHHHYHHTHFPSHSQPSAPPPPYEPSEQDQLCPTAGHPAYVTQYPSSQVTQPIVQPQRVTQTVSPSESQHTASRPRVFNLPPEPSQYRQPEPYPRQTLRTSHNQTEYPPHPTHAHDHVTGAQYNVHDASQVPHDPPFHPPLDVAHHSPESSADSQSQSSSATTEYWSSILHYQSYTDQYPPQASQPNTQPNRASYTTHYTPDAALQGIAADDSGLQETWLSYMNQVGAPRHLLDD